MVGKYIILLILGLLISLDSYSQDSTFWMELMQPEAGKINKFYIDKIGNLFICSDNGLFKSTNDGESWKRIFLGDFSSIAVDSNNCIYGLNQGHLIYSCDSGKTWLKKMINDSIIKKSYIVGFDDHDILYCLGQQEPNSKTLDIYSSSNYGTTWSINNYNFDSASSFTLWFSRLFKNGTIIIGGDLLITYPYEKNTGALFVTSDAGKSWSMINITATPKCIGYYNDSTFFIGTFQGLYFTTNKGKDWNIQFKNEDISSIVVYDEDVYIHKVYSIFYSSNYGKSWVERVGEFPLIVPVYYSSTNQLYGSAYYGGFYKSHDKGISWEKFNKGFTTANVSEIASDTFGNLISAGDCGVFKSTDNGISWISTGLTGYGYSNIAIDKNNYIYVGCPFSQIENAIYRSTDEGKYWERKFLYLPSIQDFTVKDIFVTKKGHILLGSEYELYIISTDNGNTWFENKVEGSAFCFAYNSEGHLFRGGYNGIFYRSTDDGVTWEKMKKADDYESYEFNSIVFSPYNNIGFASGYSSHWKPTCLKTTDNGRSWFHYENSGYFIVDSLRNLWNSNYKSTDYGDSWVGVFEGINHNEIYSCYVDPVGYIYLAAHNGGLYRSRDRYVSVPETQEPPGSKERLSASPNPATEYIEISGINPPAKSWAEDRIRIYNSLGEIVLFVGAIHELPLRIDVSGLPPGVYFVRLGDQAYKFLKISPSGGG